ncbi:hypothetical protein Hanom_Chr10g00930421 [Helianthus anomalus]
MIIFCITHTKLSPQANIFKCFHTSICVNSYDLMLKVAHLIALFSIRYHFCFNPFLSMIQ